MTSITIDLKGFKPLGKRLIASDKTVKKHSLIGMKKSVNVVLPAVVARTPEFSGRLKKSIKTKVLRGRHVIGHVLTRSPYGTPVEMGRKPGSKMPPVDAIQKWVIGKGIDTGETSRQTAFAIARSIGIKGIPGKFMFRDGLKASLPELAMIWNRTGDKIVRDLAG